MTISLMKEKIYPEMVSDIAKDISIAAMILTVILSALMIIRPFLNIIRKQQEEKNISLFILYVLKSKLRFFIKQVFQILRLSVITGMDFLHKRTSISTSQRSAKNPLEISAYLPLDQMHIMVEMIHLGI